MLLKWVRLERCDFRHSTTLKKVSLQRILSILISKSSKLHHYVKKVRKLYNTHYKCNHKLDPKISYLNEVIVLKKTYLLTFSSWLYHVISKENHMNASAFHDIWASVIFLKFSKLHEPQVSAI